jgi:hypothetical protein
MGQTKEERFLVKLYDIAKQHEDIEQEMDLQELEHLTGMSGKAILAACNVLAQANFIRKVGKTAIRLTSNGVELAKSLRGER